MCIFDACPATAQLKFYGQLIAGDKKSSEKPLSDDTPSILTTCPACAAGALPALASLLRGIPTHHQGHLRKFGAVLPKV